MSAQKSKVTHLPLREPLAYPDLEKSQKLFHNADLHPLGEVPKPGSVLLISDLHFDNLGVSKAKALASVVESWFARASEIIILGDIGDAVNHPDTQRFMERLSGSVLLALRRQRERGVPVFYIPGNHDVAFRRGELNWPAFQVASAGSETPVRLNRFGKKLWLSHGDEFDTDEQGGPLSNFNLALNDKPLMRNGRNVLHPLIRMIRLGLYEFDYALWGQVGLASDLVKIVNPDIGRTLHRRAEWARKGPGAFVHNLHDFEDAAREIVRREHPDVVIMGHTHVPILERIDRSIHLNTGDWQEHAVVSWMDGEGVYQQDLTCETAPRVLHFQ